MGAQKGKVKVVGYRRLAKCGEKRQASKEGVAVKLSRLARVARQMPRLGQASAEGSQAGGL